jgi:hypothetical protein
MNDHEDLLRILKGFEIVRDPSRAGETYRELSPYRRVSSTDAVNILQGRTSLGDRGWSSAFRRSADGARTA